MFARRIAAAGCCLVGAAGARGFALAAGGDAGADLVGAGAAGTPFPAVAGVAAAGALTGAGVAGAFFGGGAAGGAAVALEALDAAGGAAANLIFAADLAAGFLTADAASAAASPASRALARAAATALRRIPAQRWQCQSAASASWRSPRASPVQLPKNCFLHLPAQTATGVASSCRETVRPHFPQ